MTPRLALALVILVIPVAAGAGMAYGMRGAPLHRRLATLLYPASQLAILLFLTWCFVTYELSWWVGWLLCGLSVFCAAGDVVLFRALHAAEQRDLALARVRLLSEQIDLQRAHAEALERSIEASRGSLERVREQLDRADELLACADGAQAALTLERASDLMAAGRVRRCENRLVDALLAGKAQTCAEEKIELACDVAVPDDLELPGADLCAVFANLLDNAIVACRTAPPDRRRIEVAAHMRGGFLVVAVTNGCADETPAAPGTPARHRRALDAVAARPEAALPEHGWGTLILEGIARSHGGTFEARRTGETFCATVTLEAQGAGR